MARFLKAFLLAAAFALGATLSYFNWHDVRVDYLAGETALPLVALLLGAFLAGGLLVWLAGLGRRVGQGLQRRRMRRRLADTEAELKSLREVPSPAVAPPAAESRPPDA